MRAELPWNVAGIPPEAREAARAAARREGLSVGEWLTRRILRSFSALEEEAVAASGVPLDSWGLPVSAASRKDSEEMLAKIGRSETESTEAWRRIEDQLKGLSRRIDSSERGASENNRVLSRNAQEMNVAAREQAQIFDQLGQNIAGLNQRLERLEHSTANESIREAIKALHLGLSRLADQIGATANNSAGQLAQVTDNLEKLATQLNQVWEDAESANQLLHRRIDLTEHELGQRIDQTQHAWEARLSSAEKTAQFNTNALDHALEKIEEAAAQRTQDLAEVGRRAAQQHERATQQQESVRRLEQSFQGLEARLPNAGVEQRLDDFEHALHGLSGQLEQHDSAGAFEASLQALSFRLEKLEQDHTALLADVQARLDEIRTPPTPKPAETPEPPSFQTQNIAEPSHAFEGEAEIHQDVHDEAANDVLWAPVSHKGGQPDHSEAAEAVNGFAPLTTHGFAPTSDQESDQEFGHEPDHELGPDQDDFASDLSDVFVDQEPDNFLAQARRSAQAASEQVEGENRERLSNFRWNPESAESEEKARPRFLIPLIVALLVVLAAAAALILSQRAKVPPLEATNSAQPGPVFSVPPPPKANDIQTTVVPGQEDQTNDQTHDFASGQTNGQGNGLTNRHDQTNTLESGLNAGAPVNNQTDNRSVAALPSGGNAKDFTSQRSEPAASDVAHPQSNTASLTTQKPAAKPAAPAAAKPADKVTGAKVTATLSADRITQLANAGNATALTFLGLKALDSGNGAADAVKFLTQAAEKGQAVAQYRLGTLYERGQGISADPVKAMHWYELSANQENRKAMHNLAVAYASGPPGKRNMTEAARWFAKAAALGLSDSQFNLAVLYERGDGVPQSLVEAYKWYSIAAAAGDTESKARMSVLQTQLSEADKAQANRSATSFHAAPLNRAANVPPEAADLGN